MRQRIAFCTAGDGVRIAYATAGGGPPLVRVPNWLTHLELDWESPVWSHWLEELAGAHTLLRYDMRGSGLSERDAEDQSLDAWVGDLETVVDAAGLDRFALLGLCQGGAIAVAFAARHPQRVSRLVLYDSYAQGAFTAGSNPRFVREAEALAQMIEVGWGREEAAFRQVFANLLMPEGPGESVRWLSDLQRETASPRAARRFWNAFHRLDVEVEARKVRVPTLVFHVRGDAMVPFDRGLHLASLIPGARFVPLDGANHILLPHEPGWTRFAQELRSFLADDEAVKRGIGTFGELTPRESEVLDGVARGLSNGEIASELGIRPKTVRNHVSNVFSKLGVERRAQAIVRARDAGFGR